MAESPDPSVDPTPSDEVPPPVVPSGPIVAPAGKEYRVKRFLLALLLLGYGLLSIRDGFFVYPRENAQALRDHPGIAKLPHATYDIPLNQAFGVALPPIAIFIVAWAMYSSPGSYQLDVDDVLHIVGHPPIPLSAVTAVDRRKWDRKGIAFIEYQLADGTQGRAKLDDFIYLRVPTDRIFDRIMASMELPGDPAAAPAPVDTAGQT